MRAGCGALALLAVLVGGAVLLPPGGRAASGTAVAPTPEAPEGVGNVDDLAPQLRRAVDRALAAAAEAGVPLHVTSGWRSAAHQQVLYDAAVQKYGSAAAARRWVLPPAESQHVQGLAVDVGPAAGATWLDTAGVRFGLCRRYDNEPWHFERLAGAVGSTCPPRQPHA